MIAPGFTGVETQLWIWLIAMIRPGAAFIAAPVFGAPAVPLQLRLILSLALGLAALNSVTITLPHDGVASFEGVMMVAGEVLAGLALGFAVQIGYAAAFVAGETIGNAMGLNFAAMIDPSSGQSTQVLGTFLSVLATFLLLGMDGHLLLASFVVQSYQALPPGAGLLSNDTVWRLVTFGGSLLGAGVTVALPVGFALVLVQIIMGMLARAAPSLNLFAVGMPVAMMAGIILLAIAAPIMAEGITVSLKAGLEEAQSIAEGR
ncbi:MULTISPECIES: flagellar biosynthetic protein FliR [Sphingobium]|jgi:flagellar biosynthetic protein FliR|uniref:Flagellar biosynthetic protein FliR n=1 Tax=Sphingobium limneticum TaxID=1007511 RepID=A0A5J5I827_9SPHN|nr:MULTISPECIES: flagellar biosynthetic protein FliR [Sphingobium]MBU0932983.1 flagellar biosynthetic protein FliR [Alphaproteobacteria bacterium]KAA9019233.1 flagellar biosynthetic protein FliR [Sphingobium limneticum]KAA9019782.1 flagellar biosynthetic protein FliR [Sphingobium limneticum]KAA9032240.1 flagellar biosynthetic protein FliR [Sphingobium limneticum]BBD01931.1 flagellar biosynthetic protein FliR [Sphingobium sp. YG1]